LPWRGNVRELENVLTRAVVLAAGEVLLAENLPALDVATARPKGLAAQSFSASVEELPMALFPKLEEGERLLILRALSLTKGHKGLACDLLGISRPTLERKLQKYSPRQLATSEPNDDQ
jgi:two-component system response regulator AtoC